MASYVNNASKLAVKTPKATTTATTVKPTTTSASAQPKVTTATTQKATTTSTPSYSSISDVHNLGKQYGMDSQMLGWIADKASTNTKMDVMTPEKQSVYDAYQSYLKNEISSKANQGAVLSDPNAWKNSLYNSQVSQNVNQSYNNLNNTMTNRFDTVDTTLGNMNTGLNNYYNQFNNFEKQMNTDHNSQLDILKLLESLQGQNTTQTPTPSVQPPATSSPGHVYVPGETSNNEGYVQKQLVTNDLFNRYLQQIYQGGF